MATYRISIKTGGVKSAGTDANVFITLIGTNGNSGERQLDRPGDDFEKHSVGTYSITANPDLGTIRQVRIRHDNTGKKPGWYLEQITVHEEESDRIRVFPCNRWLAVDEDDGLIDRLLDAR